MMQFNDFQNMMGGSDWGAAPLMWINYLLMTAVLVLGIIALLKYINKK